MLLDYLHSSFISLKRNKLRSFLSAFSLSIGVAAIILISAIGEISKIQIKSEFSNTGMGGLIVGTNSKLIDIPLADKQVDIIKSDPNVEKATPVKIMYTETSMRGYVTNSVLWGIEDDADEVVSMNVIYGRMINKSDIIRRENKCVLDKNLAKSFYKRENVVGKKIKVLINGQYYLFEVVGVVETGGDIMQGLMSNVIPTFVYVPYSTMSMLTGTRNYDQVVVKLGNNGAADKVERNLKTRLSDSSGFKNGYMVQNMAQQEREIENIIDVVSSAISCVGAISLIVAGIGNMTIMLVTIKERKEEIGIKKAIGAKNVEILYEFITEAFTIAIFGSIIGVVMGGVIVHIISAYLKAVFVVNMRAVLMAVFISVLVCLSFGTYPAVRAAKLTPINALKE